MDYFRSGKHLIGYSAGSISLSSRYIHVAFFSEEVLIHWTMLLKADEAQKKHTGWSLRGMSVRTQGTIKKSF